MTEQDGKQDYSNPFKKLNENKSLFYILFALGLSFIVQSFLQGDVIGPKREVIVNLLISPLAILSADVIFGVVNFLARRRQINNSRVYLKNRLKEFKIEKQAAEDRLKDPNISLELKEIALKEQSYYGERIIELHERIDKIEA